MSRYLYELKNLLGDLVARYGEDDDSVQLVKHELEAVEARESGHQGLFALGRGGPLPTGGRHSWEGYSSLLRTTQRPAPLGSDLRAG
ncbi:hypothetical protein VAR608DRAFT_2047 [Variovorax sp. HW608]|uniref:hypothetical protein n=1 Tax=Variovorax sp. HW608 TaxID=1034889 RepID=UPI00081F776A|nr:hypothetical protein [Variovorax sp. HW608]SCK25432.1 hypothetical protein VAR608DRAFT_2047 [Variovorax sp. HW608]